MSDVKAIKKLSRDYTYSTLAQGSLESIDEILTSHTLVSTEFGQSRGKEVLKQNYKDWFNIFSNLTIEMFNVFTLKNQCSSKTSDLSKDPGHIAICQFRQKAIHVGYFKGIAPTGLQVNFDTSVMYRIDQKKIIDYHVSTDLNAILRQISIGKPLDLNELMIRPVLYGTDKSIMLRLAEAPETEKLSLREIECLSLYLNSKSAKSIANLLGLSYRTAEFYIANAKSKMSCTNKQQLVDRIIDLNLKHLFDQQFHRLCPRSSSAG